MKKILVAILLIVVMVTVPVFNAKTVDVSVNEQIIAPEGNIEKIKVLEDGSVKVRYNLYDSSNVLMYTNEYKPEIRMYDGEILIKAKEATVGEDQILKFNNLEREKEYTFVLSAPYDMLGLGIPSNTDPYELDTDTIVVPKDKSIPTANIHLTTDIDPTKLNEDSIELHYDIIDDDGALINEGTAGPRIIVQNEEGSIVYVGMPTVGTNQVENITGLESGKKYKVFITGQYDVNGDDVVDNESPYILDSRGFILEDTNTIVPEGFMPVETCKDLESIGKGANYPGATHDEAWPLDGSYALVQNIDCSETNPENINYDTTYGNDGFDSIGSEEVPFTGVLEGQQYEIDGLYINKGEENNVGLFGEISIDSDIGNVGLTNVNVTGNDYVGGLVGNAYGNIKSSYVTGNVTGQAYVGGLIGRKDNDYVGTSYSSANVKGNNCVGGLVGANNGGKVDYSYATGNVEGDINIGGLVGISGQDYISNSYATGNVTGQDYVGGLVGEIAGNYSLGIEFSYATGDVEAVNYAGGLVGYSKASSINNSYATGNVTGLGMEFGGLLGESSSSIVENSYATGDVKGGGDSILGGLVGSNDGIIRNSYAIGDVKGETAGGLVGVMNGYYREGIVENSFATGSVEGQFVGGLLGSDSGFYQITNSYRLEGNVVSGEEFNEQGKEVTLEQLLDISWYTNTLGFDENWNISPVSEGYYPHIIKDGMTELENQPNEIIFNIK